MGTFSTKGSRIADSSGAWQAICDTDVADWAKSNEFIVAIVAGTNTHGGQSSSFKLQWGVGQIPVAWNDLTGSGAMKFGTGTSLNDCTQPCASLSGCNAGEAVTDSHESENDGTTPILTATAKNDLIEAQFAVNPADAVDSTIYSFRLYDITADASLAVGEASIIMSGVILEPKAFVDTVGGADVFETLYREMGFVDSISGADVFATLYREMGFTDVGSGDDVFTKSLPPIPKAFVDAIGGSDIFTLIRFFDVVDTISGSDVFTQIYRELAFADSISGVDVFILLRFLDFVDAIGGTDVWTLTRPMYFTDSVAGSDSFETAYREMQFLDSISGVDVFTTPYREMGFSDSIAGVDIFFLLAEKDVTDTISGADVFTVPLKVIAVAFVDTGTGTEVFVTPYREMGFQDVASGLDIFELLRFLAFVDSASGSDAFSLLAMMDFSDVGSGIDVFTNPFRAMGFVDVGSGTEVFFLLAEMGFTDVGAGTDVFIKYLLTVTKIIVTTMT